MAFSSIWNRLIGLPYVLAGPILRKVTPSSVTVWLALRETAKVTLTVKDDHGAKVAEGQHDTVAVGVNLHIVAVTARPTGENLKEGIIYQYDFNFVLTHGSADLNNATQSASLGYGANSPGFALPSFALPPSDLSKVRIFHGSCRMPHGSGPDALALLDVLIEQAAANPTARPHQLLLTGDQIYADDVSAALLKLLTDAGDTLLYGDPSKASKEILPVLSSPVSTLPPYWRYDLLNSAGFTSDDMRSHLMSLSEYLAMYLFTWSDVLWPIDGDSTALPVDEVIQELEDGLKNASDSIKKQWKKHSEDEIRSDAKDVKMHYATLFRVRRLLANIPTAMICDDHEITDDWNMTLSFCRAVYNNQLARRVIQNGLVAYALCQHWGNVPEAFDKGTSTAPAGFNLLSKLDGKNAADYTNNSSEIQKIVGVRSAPDHRDTDPGSLTYNYTLEGTTYQVIVTDTRTWRTFPDGDNATGHFLPAVPSDQLKIQIMDAPALNGRALLVVLTTNVPPTQPIRSAERNPWKTRKFGGSAHPDIYDAWDLPSVAFDRLLVALNTKLPIVKSNKLPLDKNVGTNNDKDVRKGAVILLSGDVHHGFSARLKYRANRRFEDPVTQPQPASVIFAELVASSFKKQNKQTIMLHKEGYTGAPWIASEYVPPHKEEGYVGFNLPAGTVVAQNFQAVADAGAWHDMELQRAFPAVVPTIVLGSEGVTGVQPDQHFADQHNIRLLKPPDFRYRLDYLQADKEDWQPTNPPPVPPFSPGMSRQDAIKQFNQATNFYRDYNYKGTSKQQIVGLNNIGEITFEPRQGNPSFVNHTLRWKLEDSSAFAWATYNVYLDPDDDIVYPDVTADSEP